MSFLSGLVAYRVAREDVRRGLTFIYLWFIITVLVLELLGVCFCGVELFFLLGLMSITIFISILTGHLLVVPLLTFIIIHALRVIVKCFPVNLQNIFTKKETPDHSGVSFLFSICSAMPWIS